MSIAWCAAVNCSDQSLMAWRVANGALRRAEPWPAPHAAASPRAGVTSSSGGRLLWARTGKPVPYALRNGSEHLQIKGRHVLAVDDGNAYLAVGLAGMGVLWLPGTCRTRIRLG
jgi:DNA-binding transcriptional LysR family regulator